MTLSGSGAVVTLQNVGTELLQRNVEFAEFGLSPSFDQDATIVGISRGDGYRSVDGGMSWTQAGSPVSQ